MTKFWALKSNLFIFILLLQQFPQIPGAPPTGGGGDPISGGLKQAKDGVKPVPGVGPPIAGAPIPAFPGAPGGGK